MLPSGEKAKVEVRLQRPSGQQVLVTTNPKVAPLLAQMQHWPGSTWIFRNDGTYLVKFSSGEIMEGRTVEYFGVEIAIQ